MCEPLATGQSQGVVRRVKHGVEGVCVCVCMCILRERIGGAPAPAHGAQRPYALPSDCPIWGTDRHAHGGDSLGVCVSDPLGPQGPNQEAR